jgi:hypothetical protein
MDNLAAFQSRAHLALTSRLPITGCRLVRRSGGGFYLAEEEQIIFCIGLRIRSIRRFLRR